MKSYKGLLCFARNDKGKFTMTGRIQKRWLREKALCLNRGGIL
jgi:hypothetical protein